MLRCPPSRIDLSSYDLRDFEERFFARQHARNSHAQQVNVCLSPGPSRRTSFAVIPEDHNDGRKRAVSSLSQATICSTENAASDWLPVTFAKDSSGVWTVTTPSNVSSRPSDQSAICVEAARALASVAQQQQPQPQSSPTTGQPAASGPAVPGAQQVEQRAIRDISQSAGVTLDGSIDIGPPVTPAAQRREIAGSSRHGLPVLGDIASDAYPTTTPRRTVPSLLSSARARRGYARSHDLAIPEDGEDFQHLIQGRHLERIPSGAGPWPGLPPPVPELVLPPDEEIAEVAINPVLDPGAPVFVPRTRFGTATSSDRSLAAALEPRWSSLDSTHSTSNLRLRSSSEQNVDHPIRARVVDHTEQRDIVQPRHRRRSRASDQNEPVPNLERYPLLRPSTRPVTARRLSSSHRPVLMPGRQASRVSVSASHHNSSASPTVQPDATTPAGGMTMPATLDGGADQSGRTFLPTMLSSSRSRSALQPPLSEPRVGTRTSSLAWSHTSVSPTHRVPSMVSAASGISSVLSSRHSSAEGLSAAAEFLRMRSSPLDDLTERLSRLAASRPRSVGRSWERSPGQRQRPSLLTGDPFRAESAPVPQSEQAIPVPAFGNSLDAQQPVNAFGWSTAPSIPEAVELPASLPAEASSSPLPSTPPVRMLVGEASSPSSPLKDISPSKACRTPRSNITRKPVPPQPPAATPRVTVYNDAEPAYTQPQTPADICRSTRHIRGLSDTIVHGQPTPTARAAPTFPPTIPERHPHRHTYPAATPSSHIPHTITSATPVNSATSSVQHSTLRLQSGRRAGNRRTSSEENAIEGQVQMLEAERRTWEERREAGSLNDTPPGEGRFERYLS